MSLKIYNAYTINIPNTNLYSLQQIFDKLRTEITDATTASIQKKIVKKCLYYYYFKQLHGNILVEQMLQQTAITNNTGVEIHKIWEAVKTNNYTELYNLTRQRILTQIRNSNDNNINYDAKLQIVPLKNKILAMFFSSDDMEHFISNHPAFSDYYYQNQTDKPDEISDAEWEQRRSDWEAAIGPDYIPCNHGFTVELANVEYILNNIFFNKYQLQLPNESEMLEELRGTMRSITLVKGYPYSTKASDLKKFVTSDAYKKWVIDTNTEIKNKCCFITTDKEFLRIFA